MENITFPSTESRHNNTLRLEMSVMDTSASTNLHSLVGMKLGRGSLLLQLLLKPPALRPPLAHGLLGSRLQFVSAPCALLEQRLRLSLLRLPSALKEWHDLWIKSIIVLYRCLLFILRGIRKKKKKTSKMVSKPSIEGCPHCNIWFSIHDLRILWSGSSKKKKRSRNSMFLIQIGVAIY